MNRRKALLIRAKICSARDVLGVAFAPDGKTALVGSQDWGTICVLDLNGKPRYVEDFDAGGGVETLAFY